MPNFVHYRVIINRAITRSEFHKKKNYRDISRVFCSSSMAVKETVYITVS